MADAEAPKGFHTNDRRHGMSGDGQPEPNGINLGEPTHMEKRPRVINLGGGDESGYQAFIDKAMSSQQTSAEEQTPAMKAPAATKETDATDKTGNGQKGNKDKQQMYTDSEGKAWDPSRDPDVTVGKGEKGDNFIWRNHDPRIKHYPSAPEVTGPQEKETPDTGKTGKSQQGREKASKGQVLFGGFAARRQSRLEEKMRNSEPTREELEKRERKEWERKQKALPPTEQKVESLLSTSKYRQRDWDKRKENPVLPRASEAAVPVLGSAGLLWLNEHMAHDGDPKTAATTTAVLGGLGAGLGAGIGIKEQVQKGTSDFGRHRDNASLRRAGWQTAAAGTTITAASIAGLKLWPDNPKFGATVATGGVGLGYLYAGGKDWHTKHDAKKAKSRYEDAIAARERYAAHGGDLSKVG